MALNIRGLKMQPSHEAKLVAGLTLLTVPTIMSGIARFGDAAGGTKVARSDQRSDSSGLHFGRVFR
jgi:hypothetical protein